jgi:hypothetical protein
MVNLLNLDQPPFPEHNKEKIKFAGCGLLNDFFYTLMVQQLWLCYSQILETSRSIFQTEKRTVS